MDIGKQTHSIILGGIGKVWVNIKKDVVEEEWSKIWMDKINTIWDRVLDATYRPMSGLNLKITTDKYKKK